MLDKRKPVAVGLAVLLACGAPGTAANAAASRATGAQTALLDRLTWGAGATDAATISRLGTARWLDRQLHPPRTTALPAEIAARIAALPVTTTPMLDLVRQVEDLNKAANALTDPDAKAAAKKVYNDALGSAGHQAVTRSILLDLYSSDQLQEVMTWFWFNHFNVHLAKNNLRLLVGAYEQRAIRPHALGRFRDLLEATVRSPAMLGYLDNAQNANGHINENYAREIMELHTMGVGSGYSQKDVQELARILTGVGIDPRPEDPKIGPQRAGELIRQGLFEFNPNRHDYGDKEFLGHPIAGRGFAEVEEALNILSDQPATARHVSRALARQFVGDAPPPALVDRMAATFARSRGDIAAVMRTMIGSPEFGASLGTKFKDPAHYVLSAVRLAYDDRIVVNTQPIEGWMNRLAEGLYNHPTPDGYPLWAKRQIAFVPFTGTDDMSRSHFETQDTIELGQPIGATRDYGSGFMARLAATLSAGTMATGTRAPSPIAFTDQVPLSFRGDSPIPNIALGGVGKPGIDDRQAKLIAEMYAADPLAKSVREGFEIRTQVYQALAGQEVAANRGAVSPKGFELSARRMGKLMATDFNLGFVDVGGWDTHVNEGGATGYLAGRLTELGTGLAGFVEEIGPAAWADTVVVVVSEFGRTFHENGDKGTDHGHGSSYWVMGGGVRGGRITGPQVALSPASLNQGRDLPVLTDYRALMGGLFARMYGLGGDRLASVFPGAAASDLQLV